MIIEGKGGNALVAKPVGDRGASLEATAELGAGDIERLDALLHFIDRLMRVRRGHVGHLLEWHHFDGWG